MAQSFNSTVRTAMMQVILTAAGASAKGKFYNGTQATGTAANANTLLGFVTFGSVVGTVAAGVIDVDEAAITQINSAHIAGTATHMDLTTSADVIVGRFSMVGGSGNMTITGAVAPNVNITFTAPVTIADGNP